MDTQCDTEIRSASERLLGALRVGEGLDENAVEELRNALRRAAVKWRDCDVVPKSMTNLFVDLCTGFESCRYLYPGPEGDRISIVGDEIADLVREVLRLD